jgi:hypothetical protein
MLKTYFPDYLFRHVGSKYPRFMMTELKRFVGDAEDWRMKFQWMEDLDFDTADKELVTSDGGNLVVVGKTSIVSHFFSFWLVHILVLRELKRNDKYS